LSHFSLLSAVIRTENTNSNKDKQLAATNAIAPQTPRSK
jgi:hypothetical protein